MMNAPFIDIHAQSFSFIYAGFLVIFEILFSNCACLVTLTTDPFSISALMAMLFKFGFFKRYPLEFSRAQNWPFMFLTSTDKVQSSIFQNKNNCKE